MSSWRGILSLSRSIISTKNQYLKGIPMKPPNDERQGNSMEISKCMRTPQPVCRTELSHPWSEENVRKQSSTGLLNCWGRKKTEIDRLSSICCCIAIFLHLPGAALSSSSFVSEENNFCSYSSKVVLWNTFLWVENITHIWWKTKWEKENCNFLKNMAGGSTIMIWQLIFSPGHVFIWDQGTKNECED